MTERHPVQVLLLMGVSGCGKSTIGEALSNALGWPFRDADSFHPPANIAKMSRGMPLADEDRWPWLDAIAAWIDAQFAQGDQGIVSCSALKRVYRERIVGTRQGIGLVFLQGGMDLIAQRLAERRDHFMPPALLQSQFAALEEPHASERPLVVAIEAQPAQIASEIMTHFDLKPAIGS